MNPRPRGVPFFVRLRATSLGTRLALLGAAVTAVVVLVTFAVLRRSTEADVQAGFIHELRASQAVMQSVRAQNQELLLQTAALLANSPTLKAALDAGRTERDVPENRTEYLATIQSAASALFTEVRQDLWVVTDDSGRVMASGGNPAAPAQETSLARLPVVRSALALDSMAGPSLKGVHRQGSDALQIAAAPIVIHGNLVGTVLIGESITIPSADSAMDIRGVVVVGDTVLVSTLHDIAPGERWAPKWVREGDSHSVLELNGQQYVVVRLPLGLGDDDRHSDLFMLRSMTDALNPILRALTQRFVLIGGLVVLLVGIGGGLTTRATLRPLSRFVTFMRAEAGAKEYAQFDEPNAAAEINLLTRAYNRLIASLQRGHEDLQQRTDELATANERLQRQVRERERAERALRESEEQLRQSQKLEALGALAGGVAHDFNNILSIILGYAEIVRTELPGDSSQHADVSKISDAAVRARALVRQLLAFSRKQVLQPQVLNLSDVVNEVQPLLRPLLGDHIVLEVHLDALVAPVMADLVQIEQVILNLVVNARDAMPNGGRLLIETSDVTLDEVGGQYPLPGGLAVMLSVSDSGSGMDAATRSRIFEPFFTTKPVGKGTGLGLATVYGIVRQSGGNITVFSEPGEGATFRCYFPAAIAADNPRPEHVVAPSRASGAETILVAEDEDELRALLRRSLLARGFHVLEARDGVEALDVARSHQGRIHLLATDVVMPHLSGTQLAAQLHVERPDMRVLFMSGYSNEAIEQHGVLTPDSVFLQKPVSPESLARAVRELLDADLTTAAVS